MNEIYVEKRTHKVLLVWVFGVQQMDEATHEALLLSKVLRVGIVGWLVWLVLNERGYQVQDGVHLEKPGRGRLRSVNLCLKH